jgi:hypothetical protein
MQMQKVREVVAKVVVVVVKKVVVCKLFQPHTEYIKTSQF